MQPASRRERVRGHRAIVPSEFVPEGSGRADAKSPVVSSAFLIARNPEADSTLPFLIFIPIDGGLWLKARESWPRASRVYCHPVTDLDTSTLALVDRVVVVSCVRRGPVIDLVLERAQNRRAQFVFTHARGRSMIFWQTAKSAANARPGLRVPKRPSRALERIAIDTRERYGYTFKGHEVPVEREALRVGDYVAYAAGIAVAVVERKAMDDFCTSLVDGTLGFAMADLAQFGTSAVVVEGTYTQLLRRAFVDGAWLGEIVARLQVRYPSVHIIFAETRTLGERWTFDFFKAAATENPGDVVPEPEPEPLPSEMAPLKRTRRKKV